MRSSQAARGLLTAVGRAAPATGIDRAAFGPESDGVVTSSFADFSFSSVAFLTVNDAAALEAGSAARTELTAADAAGCGADAAARAGTAAEAALCAGTAGADADSCGAVLLADAMAAWESGATLGLDSSLKAMPATASAAKPANSQTALRDEVPELPELPELKMAARFDGSHQP